MKLARNLILVLAAIFVAGVVVELVPALKETDAWIGAHRGPLLLATGGTAGLGLLLLIGSVIVLLMDSGDWMSHTEIEQHKRTMKDAGRPWARRLSTYRFRGAAGGLQGHDEFSFRELKNAVRSGTALRSPLWRPRLCAICGGMLMFIGIVGVVAAVAPAPLKLLAVLALAYALVRIAWGLARA
jgi:hypothetical protein